MNARGAIWAHIQIPTRATLPEPVTVPAVILPRALVKPAIFGRVESPKTPSHLDKFGWVERELMPPSPLQVTHPLLVVWDLLSRPLATPAKTPTSVTVTPQPVPSPITPHSLPKVQTPTETPSPKPPPNKNLKTLPTPFAHVVRSTQPSDRSHAIPPRRHPSFPTFPAPQLRRPKGPSWPTLGVFCGGLLGCVVLFSVSGYLPALGTWM